MVACPIKAGKQVVKTVSDLFPHPRPHCKATSRRVDESDKQFLFKKLSGSAACPMQWRIDPETTTLGQGEASLCEPVPIDQLLDVFKEDQSKFFEECSASKEEIAWLAENSSEQRKSNVWGKHRYLCLTGSNFGLVLAAMGD